MGTYWTQSPSPGVEGHLTLADRLVSGREFTGLRPQVQVLKGTLHRPTDSKTDWLVEVKLDLNLQDATPESEC
jgi:hypothetical protein